uniref:Uncharacterized protein n=1 Tax=Lepeophtheirus salmonis TaxID=72036 RepID=A0A0K2TTV5_LEPSM
MTPLTDVLHSTKGIRALCSSLGETTIPSMYPHPTLDDNKPSARPCEKPRCSLEVYFYPEPLVHSGERTSSSPPVHIHNATA